jgi:hypothetical protein
MSPRRPAWLSGCAEQALDSTQSVGELSDIGFGGLPLGRPPRQEQAGPNPSSSALSGAAVDVRGEREDFVVLVLAVGHNSQTVRFKRQEVVQRRTGTPQPPPTTPGSSERAGATSNATGGGLEITYGH